MIIFETIHSAELVELTFISYFLSCFVDFNSFGLLFKNTIKIIKFRTYILVKPLGYFIHLLKYFELVIEAHTSNYQ